MTHCSSQLMAWLISSYLLPWSLQMFAQLPLVPAGHFTQLSLVSFNLNLLCPLFLSCFLFAGHFYSTQYLSRSRSRRYYNTTLVTAGDWRWFLPYRHHCLFRSFFQSADNSSGHKVLGQHNSNPSASAEVVLIWLTSTGNSNSGNEVWWTLVWATQAYCAPDNINKILRGASIGGSA